MDPRYHIYLLLLIVKYLFSCFNNTSNPWFTFVEPLPTASRPDPRLDPHRPRPRLFQFYNIFNSWFTSTRPPPKHSPRLFNFQISLFLGAHPPDAPLTRPHPYSEKDFIRGIYLEGPIVFNTMIRNVSCLLFRMIKMSQKDLVIF